MRSLMWSLSLALIVAANGCGTSTQGVPDDGGVGMKPDGGRCVPGDTQSCICLGGGMGAQTCRATGSSYGSCVGCAGDNPEAGTRVDGGGNLCGDCDGCCNGTTCVKFMDQTTASCGGRGTDCAACPGSKICAAGTGTCVDASAGCGACTGGCCQNSVCLVNQASACGSACTKCTYGVTCVSGACTTMIDSNAAFKVYVKTAVVAVSGTCKNNWDTFSDPDPQVFVGFQSGGNFIEGHTKYASDTLSATYSDTTGLIVDDAGNPLLIPAGSIAAGTMRVTLADYDYPDPNDTIGQGYFPATTMLMSPFSTGAFGCVTDITFDLR